MGRRRLRPLPPRPRASHSVPASPTTTQTASLGNYRIQLASLKSEAAAQKTWKRLAAKYKDVLASLTVHIQKVALTSSAPYYRLQAGPFEDKIISAPMPPAQNLRRMVSHAFAVKPLIFS